MNETKQTLQNSWYKAASQQIRFFNRAYEFFFRPSLPMSWEYFFYYKEKTKKCLIKFISPICVDQFHGFILLKFLYFT